MKRWATALLLALGLGQAHAQEAPAAARYAEGQVWEYHTRPKDAGSLIRIQRIEPYGPGKVYHLTVIGVRLGNASTSQVLRHIPVSQQTLDASVTRLVPQPPAFPGGVEDGIAEWKKAEGGVFTITLAEIVDLVEKSVPQN